MIRTAGSKHRVEAQASSARRSLTVGGLGNPSRIPGKIVLAAALALTAGALAASCNSPRPAGSHAPDTSRVSMEIVLASGTEVTSVDYEVTGNGITPRTGTVDVSGKNSKLAFLVTGLPPGTGYLVKLSAKGAPPNTSTTCAGEARFDVVAGQTTVVSVLLQCRKPADTGAVAVNGEFNGCPVVTAKSVSPLATDVGKTIAVAATAADPDCVTTSGGTCTKYEDVTLAWTASGGTIVAGMTPGTATFTCTAAGTFDLTLTIGDGKCNVTDVTQVTCVSDLCGNGTIDSAAGEECDGTTVPNPGQRCDANCRIIAQCGNGIREGAEQCDPPSVGPGQANLCDSMCRTIFPRCGDNLVQASVGEECDPPVAGVCTATCKNFVAVCGNGQVEGTEQCDDGNTTAGDGCENCRTVATACEACESSAYPATSACNPDESGCSRLTGADKTLCENLVKCVRMTGCADNNTGDTQPCYCGTASDISCLGGNGNGSCKAAVEAAAKTSDPGLIAEGFADPDLPLGRAANLIKCDAAACKMQCTF